MKEGWKYKKFVECVEKNPKQKQVKSKDYKLVGKFPIVSQEKEIISGYWDDEEYLFKHNSPVIVFGDHTKEIKYIDFDFVVGADGTHILQPKDDIIPRFFYYALKATPLRSLGYARHFKLLKEHYFYIPPLSEQQQIVDRLDSAFAKIDAVKTNAEKQLNDAKALFQKELSKAMTPKERWEEKRLGEVCELCQGLAINSKTKYLLKSSGLLPLLRIKDMKDGKREIFVDEKNCPQNCIANEDDIIYTRTGTLGLVFTGMKGVLHNNCFKITFDKHVIDKTFLMYFLSSEDFKSKIILLASRAAQPDITHKLFKAQTLNFPSVSEQNTIVATLNSFKTKVDKLQDNYYHISHECDAMKQVLLRQVFE